MSSFRLDGSDRLLCLCSQLLAPVQAPQLVKGPGVVGQQPVLEPGQSFEYSSACPITCAPKEGYQVSKEMGARWSTEEREGKGHNGNGEQAAPKPTEN